MLFGLDVLVLMSRREEMGERVRMMMRGEGLMQG